MAAYILGLADACIRGRPVDQFKDADRKLIDMYARWASEYLQSGTRLGMRIITAYKFVSNLKPFRAFSEMQPLIA